MNNSKFYQVFSSLSSKEKNDFIIYLSSPLNNTNQLFVKLTKFIFGNEKKIEQGKISKDEILNQIQFSEKSETYMFNHYLVYILKLLNTFIIQNEVGNYTDLCNYILLESYKKRGIEPIVESKIKELKKDIEKNDLKNSNYYLNKYNIEKEYELYLHRNEIGVYDESCQSSVTLFDTYFISSRLKESCDLYGLNSFKTQKFDTRITDFFSAYIEDDIEIFKNISCVYIYHQIIKLFKNNDTQLFNDLSEYIKLKESDFTKVELRQIYFHLIAFCQLQEKLSKDAKEIEYYFELELSLYKYLIDIECLFQGEPDSHLSYHNIVNACIILKKYDYAREFISSYKNRLPITKQELYYKRALVSLYRKEKKYKEAIKLLRSLSSNNLFIELDIKQSLLALYLLNRQLDDFEWLHAAFRVFLRRKKEMLPEYLFNLLNNYLIIIKKIFFLKLQFRIYDKDEYNQLYGKLYQQILDMQPILHKGWLLKQLDRIAVERPIIN